MKIDSVLVASAAVSVALIGCCLAIADRLPRYQIVSGPTFAYRMDVKTGAVQVCAIGLSKQPAINGATAAKPDDLDSFHGDFLGPATTQAPRHVQPVDCE